MLGILAAASITDINSTTPVLAVMIGLAVGIDYALFIVSRAREYLAEGVEPAEAAGRATATSGGAVVFAGTTVIVALCGLSVAGIRFLTTMGLASAAVVAVSVLVALTVVPALIGLLGQRLLPRRRKAAAGGADADRRPASRWVRTVTRRPWMTIGAVVVLLGLCAVPAGGLRLALTDNGFAEKGTQQRETYDAVAAAYGEGYNFPIVVIADVSTMELVRNIRSHAGDYGSRYGLTNVMVTGQTAVAIDVAEELNDALIPLWHRGGGPLAHPPHGGLPLRHRSRDRDPRVPAVAGGGHGGRGVR